MISRELTVTQPDGKEVQIVVNSPSSKDVQEAAKVYNTAFTDALKSKSVVRARLDDLLIDQGLWDEKKQMKLEEIQKSLLDNERTLAKGGISLQKAKQVALEMKKLREEMRDLISVKTSLDSHTAEGQADNARFNYLVYACGIYKETNQKVYANYEDYQNRQNEMLAVEIAQTLANMLYGLDNDYEKNLPENQFLKQYKFVDDSLRLINKDGHFVDQEGRLLDENGRYINDKGEYVDKYGHLVDKEGDYKVDFEPFLDDKGNPVLLEDKEDKEEKEVKQEVEEVEDSETSEKTEPKKKTVNKTTKTAE
jgi:hypothetical protein